MLDEVAENLIYCKYASSCATIRMKFEQSHNNKQGSGNATHSNRLAGASAARMFHAFAIQ